MLECWGEHPVTWRSRDEKMDIKIVSNPHTVKLSSLAVGNWFVWGDRLVGCVLAQTKLGTQIAYYGSKEWDDATVMTWCDRDVAPARLTALTVETGKNK